jgi:hypothetical protein
MENNPSLFKYLLYLKKKKFMSFVSYLNCVIIINLSYLMPRL